MDQGPRPLCLPFSLSLAHDAIKSLDSSVDAAMAPEAIWWHCAQRGQTTPEGMALKHAGEALRRSGQPPLSRWPWNPSLGYGTEEPPTAAGVPPWQQAEPLVFEPAHDSVEDQIEEALAAGYPVLLVVEVTHELQYPAADGSIDVPDIRSPHGEYHAVLVVGAASDQVKGRRLLIRNSWSEAWGAGGYGWLPLDYLVANAVQAAIVIDQVASA
ncbi:MAG: C1 family peptidase [Verrucomicrobiales bacterium]|nr:C1 family peptidase [Verrucomicrobiales bacterium]